MRIFTAHGCRARGHHQRIACCRRHVPQKARDWDALVGHPHALATSGEMASLNGPGQTTNREIEPAHQLERVGQRSAASVVPAEPVLTNGRGDHDDSSPAARNVVPDRFGHNCNAFEIHTDTDMVHGDTSASPAATESSLSTCCAMCFAHGPAACAGFTLTAAGECWLKNAVTSPIKQRGLTSGVRLQWGGAAAVLRAATPAMQLAGAARQTGEETRAAVQSSVDVRPAHATQVADGCSSDPSTGCMARPAVVVMSHDRPEMTRRCLAALFALPLVERFTIYVSEDGQSQQVRQAAAEFGDRVHEVLSFTPRLGRTAFTRGGVYKIAQHFRAALEATLFQRGHSHAVMIEDDLLLSPDFLRLFWSTAWLLRADTSLWCVSAWNDQGYPHTARDSSRLHRTDYFPGLGWMISSETWSELRAKWPDAPTTGWDHWMRLSSTSRGRECVVPEINRSRHASKRGTNVLDNKPFERFTFETVGVETFGDVSYLLRQHFEPAAAAAVRHATRAEWPSSWGGSVTKDAALAWMRVLPKPPSPPTLLLYVREEYRGLAKALGLWAENQRATHNGTITLHTASGAALLLADRRRCPYLLEAERIRPPARMKQLAAPAGVSCVAACAGLGARCDPHALEWGNSCEALAQHFACEAGCGHQVGPELPAYASSSDLDTFRQCLVSDIAISTCDASFRKTARLCTCV